jgi:hypothetical protein
MVCCILQWFGGAVLSDDEALRFPRFPYIAYLVLFRPSSSDAVERVFSVSDIVNNVMLHW